MRGRVMLTAVNERGSRVLAEEAAACGARLVLVSTDYVFAE